MFCSVSFRACRALLSVLFVVLPGVAAVAQGTVRGRLRDGATSEALPFANVLLFKAAPGDSGLVKGGASAEDGGFQLTGIPAGAYTLRASVVGYKPLRRKLTVADTDLDLGDLRLPTLARQLGQVNVTGEKATVQDDLNKRVINVGKDLTSVAGTAVDVLQNVPSVQVDQNGTVSLRGAENVTILIDGKPSGLASGAAALAQIPASRIDRVEIVTNPSARYDADGAGGVINIILKKESTAGLNGLAALNVGTRDKYNGTLSLNYRRGAWNTFGSYDYRQERRFGRRTTNQTLRVGGDEEVSGTQTGTSINHEANHTGRLGLEWAPDERRSITLAVQPRFSENTSSDNLRTARVALADGTDFGSFNRRSEQDNEGRSADFSLDFRRAWPVATPKPDTVRRASSPRTGPPAATGPGESARQRGTGGAPNMAEPRPGALRELTGSVVLTPSRQRNHLDAVQTFDTTSTRSQPQRQGSDTRLLQGSARVDYLTALARGSAQPMRLETGVKATVRRFDLDNQTDLFDELTGTFRLDTARSNRFRYTEQVYAAYATVQRTLAPKWSTQLGLRVEATRTEGVQLVTGQRLGRAYVNPFPSALLAYELNASHRAQLSYSRRINRPDVQSLNPFVDIGDPLNLRYGNPRLRPEYLNALELGYQWFKGKITVSPTLFYRRTTNTVQRYGILDSAGIFRVSFQNLGSNTTSGAELTVNGPLAKWVRVSASGSVFHQQVRGTGAGSGGALVNNSGKVSTARLSLNLTPRAGTELQLTYNYRGAAVTSQGQRLAIQFGEIALSQKLLPNDRGTLTLRVSDVFDTQEFRIKAAGSNFDTRFTFKRESRIGWIGFTYRFGREEQRAQRQRKRGGLNDNEGGQTGGGEG